MIGGKTAFMASEIHVWLRYGNDNLKKWFAPRRQDAKEIKNVASFASLREKKQ
jgi:hypothetical protein